MKVGRETAVCDTGSDREVVIYATNMIPKVLTIPPWMSEEARRKIVAVAMKDYEKRRKQMAKQYGETETDEGD